MSKYVIDLRPDCKVVQEICESDGHVSIGARSIEYLEELNTDYVNEHFGILQDDAYNAGFENGKKESYQQGLEDGKKQERERIINIFAKPLDDPNAFSVKDLWTLARITKNLENQKEIKVGDEVYCKDDDESDSGVVTWVGNERICAMWQDGSAGEVQKDELVKTGRHFDIKSILEAMRNDR